MGIDFVFLIIILILSVVLHEVSHGYVAEALGDPTARLAGRLTLNPFKHLDLWGSFIIPLFLIISKAGFLIGWAKPVPYNPYNLKNQRWGEALVAGAGPAVNIVIAFIFGLIIRFGISSGMLTVASAIVDIMAFIVYINLLLAFFNLIPIPPLDGSKVLSALLPYHLAHRFMSLQTLVNSFMVRYGVVGMFLFIFLFFFVFINFIWPPFSQLLTFLFVLITGQPFLL